MISAMIVDDEYWVRVGIKKQAMWRELGIESVYEAKNGKEALSEALQKKPEIIITDMRMPVMDGVELLRRVRNELPSSKVIIVSGYSDFKYMQEAIKCGAFSYLLKPVKEKELNDTLCSVVSKILKEREEAKKWEKLAQLNNEYVYNLKDKLLNDYINNEISLTELLAYNINGLNSIFCSDKYCVVMVGIVNSCADFMNAEREKKIINTALKYDFEEIIKNERCCLYFKKSREEYIIIVGFDKGDSHQHCEERIAKMCLKLSNVLECNDSVKVKILIGNMHSGIDGIIKSYKELVSLKNDMNLLGQEKLLFVKSLLPIKSNRAPGYAEEYKLLEQYIKNCNKSEISKLINDMFNKMTQHGYISINNIKNMAFEFDTMINNILKEYNSSFQSICHEKAWYMEDMSIVTDLNKFKTYFLNTCANTVDVIISKRDEDAKKLILQIVEYVNNNYGEDIKLSTLSQKYYFNLEYISRIFKRETGMNFSDYLREIRMKKALEFLKRENLKIADIASMLGYNDEHYFSKVFKEYYNYTPSQYRKLLYKI